MRATPPLFTPATRGITQPHPARVALRASGPIVRVDAPAGGPAWIVTDDAVARAVLTDPRIVKDPAFAPPTWTRSTAGLEPTAAEQPSLTTLDGPEHARLRKAHAPLLSAKRMAAYSDRVHEIARRLLADAAAGAAASGVSAGGAVTGGAAADASQADAGPTIDLMADFTTRYPLTVLLDLLGIPPHHVDQATAACRQMLGDAAEQGQAIAALRALADAGLTDTHQHAATEPRGPQDQATGPRGYRGLADELRARMPAGTSADDLSYHLFALIFAGQLTTDAALGFLVARTLTDDAPVDTLVQLTLREHPPAPFTLWRFTTTDVRIGDEHLPARSPVLVDIEGINTDPVRASGPDLTFGAGHHFCVGARLALLELTALATVLRGDYPDARLAVPYAELRRVDRGGTQGTRLAALPVRLGPGASPGR
ncbi:cytochrome P450 [Saccharothrix australiensis]|uniref:Cytochrome P450 n=1 Tax=Saccharothrix australiensis TaxID=2072 RepID=A0A495W2B0_9PSEU|nr:cytochrome P450 [Saccharothrix australiensis]RKT54865.1 cytochrome P450 [Saccharothrix australiensis]